MVTKISTFIVSVPFWALLLSPFSACTATVSVGCENNSECNVYAICVESICRTTCNASDDCLAHERCADGICFPAAMLVDAGIGHNDAAIDDVIQVDVMFTDTFAHDSNLPDSNLPDSNLPDSSLPDSSLPDSSLPDSRLPDSSLPDSRLPDSRLPDSSLPDSLQLDTAQFDGSQGDANAEICNDGLDNDNDFIIDEGCPCVTGATQNCYSGLPEHAGVGSCSLGLQECDDNNWWGACLGSVMPIDEICGGNDEDCDGDYDEGCVICRDVNIVSGAGLSSCNAIIQDVKTSCLADGCTWGGPEYCTIGGSASSATLYGALVQCD